MNNNDFNGLLARVSGCCGAWIYADPTDYANYTGTKERCSKCGQLAYAVICVPIHPTVKDKNKED